MEKITKLNIKGIDYQISDESYSLEKETLASKEEVMLKQDLLVSGTNIKTINGQSILGDGNITVMNDTTSIPNISFDVELYNNNNLLATIKASAFEIIKIDYEYGYGYGYGYDVSGMIGEFDDIEL